MSAMEHKRPSPPDAKDGPRPEDLSNRALLLLLAELAEELALRSAMPLGAFRGEFDRTILDAVEELEKLIPERRKNVSPAPAPEAPRSGLTPAKLKAIRAAIGAGVPLVQVAKHFGLTRAELRKTLAP